MRITLALIITNIIYFISNAQREKIGKPQPRLLQIYYRSYYFEELPYKLCLNKILYLGMTKLDNLNT